MALAAPHSSKLPSTFTRIAAPPPPSRPLHSYLGLLQGGCLEFRVLVCSVWDVPRTPLLAFDCAGMRIPNGNLTRPPGRSFKGPSPRRNTSNLPEHRSFTSTVRSTFSAHFWHFYPTVPKIEFWPLGAISGPFPAKQSVQLALLFFMGDLDRWGGGSG